MTLTSMPEHCMDILGNVSNKLLIVWRDRVIFFIKHLPTGFKCHSWYDTLCIRYIKNLNPLTMTEMNKIMLFLHVLPIVG